MIKRKERYLYFFCDGSHTGYLLGQLVTMEREFQTCGSQLKKPSPPLPPTYVHFALLLSKLQDGKIRIMGEILDMNIHALAYTRHKDGLSCEYKYMMDCLVSKLVPYNFH